MRIPRIYINQHLEPNTTIELPKDTVTYLNTVLRRTTGCKIILFNNRLDPNNYYGEYTATLIPNENKNIKYSLNAEIIEYLPKQAKQNITIELAQCISKPSHFEITLQKAVELGVNIISPLTSKRSEQNNKTDRWEKITTSASEQSIRCDLAELNDTIDIHRWTENNKNLDNNTLVLVLCTKTKFTLKDFITQNNINKYINLKIIIGPEGGFDDSELALFNKYNFNLVKLGDTILRTETASIAILSILQYIIF